MAFPTGWTQSEKLTIDATKVGSGGVSSHALLLTAPCLPTEMLDADGPNPAINGGGDVRFSADAAGTMQLPLEVVTFVTNNNPALAVVQLWVLTGALSDSVDGEVWVWWGKSGETQPAVTDPYGRNAVWPGISSRLHLGQDPSGSAPQYVDSTGNANDGTANGGVTREPFVIGDGADLDGSTGYINIVDSASLQLTTAGTISTWFEFDVIQECDLISKRFTGTLAGFSYVLQYFASGTQLRILLSTGSGLAIAAFDPSITTGIRYYVRASWDASTLSLYLNGSLVASAASVVAQTLSGTDVYVGVAVDASTPTFFVDGLMDEVSIQPGVTTLADHVTDYNNQLDPPSFVYFTPPVFNAAFISANAILSGGR